MILIDWGTSGFRAYRVTADGRVTERREAALGILAVPDGDFAAACMQQVGDWLRAGEHPLLMSGMIGSRQGWRETPYADCPAGVAELAAGLVSVDLRTGARGWIVPGLSCRDDGGIADVMRGEETQILGVLDRLGAGAQTVCLPGTHSKWVRVEAGRIRGFRTYMTGEVYAVLRGHSILGRMMQGDATDGAHFEAGVQRAREAGGLLHHLFGVRASGLFGELAAADAAAYLSGILIGHELRAAAPARGQVHLLGAPALSALYQRALGCLGVQAQLLDSDAAVRGLIRLAADIPERT